MTGAVRLHLGQHTRLVHKALHADPVLSRLTTDDVDEPAYRMALSAFSAFYETLEKHRAALLVWPEFDLNTECVALSEDLGQPTAPMQVPDNTTFENAPQMLGALYVAHGAAFGRAGMAKVCKRALPGRLHGFLDLPNNPKRWRNLVATLERCGERPSSLRGLEIGASRAFGLMQRAAQTVKACSRTAA